MYYYVLLKGFCLSNSLKCTNSHYFLFADILKLFVHINIFTLKGWSISNSVKDNISLALNFEHRNFADVFYAQTATLHTKVKKSEIIISDPLSTL